MNRRLFLQHLSLGAVATCLPWFGGCGKSPTLTVELHLWVGYETLHLARDFKWLPSTIIFHDDLTLGESLRALESGEADAACMTLDEMLLARASGLHLSAALVFDISAGADMVMARPEINALTELENKRIGFDPGAVGALVFAKLMEVTGLPPTAVTQVDLPPAKQIEAWRRGEVDAVITYEPIASALKHEGAHNLFDSRQMPNTIIGVLAVRHDHPKVLPLVRQLVAAHFRALDYLHSNKEDSIRRLSVRDGISPEEVRLALASITLPSLAANRGYLLGSDPWLVHVAENLSRLMVRYGLLSQEDDLQHLILPDALPDY
jgi:NitT/TauT family transport system substrate-binding protein